MKRSPASAGLLCARDGYPPFVAKPQRESPRSPRLISTYNVNQESFKTADSSGMRTFGHPSAAFRSQQNILSVLRDRKEAKPPSPVRACKEPPEIGCEGVGSKPFAL
jgi:hypothetical protein